MEAFRRAVYRFARSDTLQHAPARIESGLTDRGNHASRNPYHLVDMEVMSESEGVRRAQ